VLRSTSFLEPACADFTRRLFTDAGMDAARLTLAGGAEHAAFLGFYNDADIALDPFPYTGGLTTLEALWMGVPVVALAGASFAGRHSLSHLTNVGLAELVAQTPDDYVRIAQALATDPQRIAALRAGLRQRMRASALLDPVAYTRALESAYRALWQAWCARSEMS
jgi:predicted O-linked N-acetylglucosamine transferase (SPINDLY family)